jgi:hypothetical protein
LVESPRGFADEARSRGFRYGETLGALVERIDRAVNGEATAVGADWRVVAVEPLDEALGPERRTVERLRTGGQGRSCIRKRSTKKWLRRT